MTDRSHLHAIEYRLHRERVRLAAATTPQEREARTVWVQAAEKELVAERAFLGLSAEEPEAEMTMDEIMKELSA